MAAKLSSEQTELERKLERNRAAFEAWLERKKEEQRVKKSHRKPLLPSIIIIHVALSLPLSLFDIAISLA